MIIHPAKQRTPDWFQARVGVATASQFHRLITKTGKPSSSAQGYLHELIAERYIGAELDGATTNWMERGQQLEDAAVAWYELITDAQTTEVGLCFRDDKRVGCSPDRLIGEDGGLEIKVPKPAVHIGYLIGDPAVEYKAQVQGCLWVCEREWWDLVSFNPVLPSAKVRCYRDEPYIATLSVIVEGFLGQLEIAKEKMDKLVTDKLTGQYTQTQAG